MNKQDLKRSTEFERICNSIGQSFLLGSSIGIPCYFFHGYRYAPISGKFQAGWQLAKTRGVLLGTNFLVWRMIFEGSNYLLKNYRGKDDVLNWAAGGAFVGWILSVRAGPKIGLIWAVVYSGFYQGQYIFNQQVEKLKNKYLKQDNIQLKNIQDINDQICKLLASLKVYQSNIIMLKDFKFPFLDNFKYNILEGLSNVL